MPGASRLFKLLLSLVGAALVAVLTLFYVAPSAEALDPYGSGRAISEMSQAEKAFRIKKMMEGTHPTFYTTSSEAQAQLEALRNQRVATRAARSKLPGLATSARAGLLGVAAGIWIHNGVTLWNLNDCGHTSCEPVELDVQLQQATDMADGGSGAVVGGVSRAFDFGGNVKGAVMVESVSVDYNVGTRTITSTATWHGNWAPDWQGSKTGGEHNCEKTSGSGCIGYPAIPTTYDARIQSPKTTTGTWSLPLPQGTGKPYSQDWLQGKTQAEMQATRKYYGPTLTAWEDFTWEHPVYDWGQTSVGALPSGTPYEATGTESDEFYNSTVADPEAPPQQDDPETEENEEIQPLPTVPDYFPSEWEHEFPDIAPPGEGPYEDPDQDGEPNHEDQDDDGDGTPDEDDPNPFTLPVEAPQADPDEDGIPNEEDEDDDGDGIPDEYDPEPYVTTLPTDLPDEHDYADPDEDGVPNHQDEDDDGDGIPDEIDPRPHIPDQDTDGDQIPDEEDPDDDNDGIPDEVDPDPETPTDPETLPEYHPYANPDASPPPNRQDQDDDDDGMEDWEDDEPWIANPPGEGDEDLDDVPDWEDPWPGNPYAPARRTQDTDEDDIPDFKDPVPESPTTPWAPSRPDYPGNPTIDAPPASPNSPRWPGDSPTREMVPPTNHEYPNSPTRPNTLDAPDPTSTTHPTTPVSRDAPDDPAVPGSPDPPPTSSCENPRQPSWEVPRLMIEDVFPFSLVIWAWGLMGALVSEPVTPVWELGMLGTVDLGQGAFYYIVVTGRTLIWVVAGIGMAFLFYTWIRSGSS